MTFWKRSLLNLFSASLGQLMMIAIGFLLPRLFITNFGSEVNGLLSSANQILVYLAIFEAGVGGVTLQALYGPVSRKAWGAINGILSATNIYYKKASVMYLATLAAVAVVYPFVVSVALPPLTVSLVIFFVGLPQVVSFFVHAKYILLLRADGKNFVLTALITLVSVTAGLAKVFLLLRGMQVLPVIIIQCIIQMAQAVYITHYVKKRYPEISVDSTPDYKAISQKNYMLVHQLGGLVYHNTDIMVLTMVAGLKVVSVYSIYKLVMSQFGNMLYNLQNSVDFVLGQTYQRDKSRYRRRIDQFEAWFSALAFSLYAVIYFLMFSFVKLYTYGVEDAVYADHLLVILFVVIELLSVMRQSMQQTINYAGHFKNTMPQTLIETGIKLVLSIAGVYLFGIYGVLAATIVSQLYRVNDVILYANKRLLHRSAKRTYAIHAVNILLFLLAQIVFTLAFSEVYSWWGFLKTGVLACMISLPLYFIVQTSIWSETRVTFWYYLMNSPKIVRSLLRRTPKKPTA